MSHKYFRFRTQLISSHIRNTYRLTHASSSSHKRKFVELYRLTHASLSSHKRKFVKLHRLTHSSSSSHKRKFVDLNCIVSIVSQTELLRLTHASSNCIVSHTQLHRLTYESSSKRRTASSHTRNFIVSRTKVRRTASSHNRKFVELHRLTHATSSSHKYLTNESSSPVLRRSRGIRPCGQIGGGLRAGVGLGMGWVVGARLYVAQGAYSAFHRRSFGLQLLPSSCLGAGSRRPTLSEGSPRTTHCVVASMLNRSSFAQRSTPHQASRLSGSSYRPLPPLSTVDPLSHFRAREPCHPKMTRS